MSPAEQPVKTRRSILSRISGKATSLLVSGTEMVLAVVLVFVLALAFMGILMLSFPKGTGLVDLYDELVQRPGSHSAPRVQGVGRQAANFVAVLASVQRRVRDRPADAITWNTAREGMRLQHHHTIQTLAQSAATITFGQRSELQLNERSLVVVKSEAATRGLGGSRPSIVLLGGKVQGKIVGAGDGPSRIDIVTAGGTSEIVARDEGAEYSVEVNPDESSTVYLFSGEAEVETAEGTRSVGPNEAITLDRDGSIGLARTIADPPVAIEPRNGTIRTYGSVAPRIRFEWEARQDADSYRLVLARDPGFTKVVYEGRLHTSEFVHGDLASGQYYWRVNSVSDSVESRPGEVREFQLVQDLEPPGLEVDLPDEVATAERLLVRGRTEPGSELFIENKPVPVTAKGTFEYAIELKRGLNMIVIEAVDPAGNSNYKSQYVTARY